MFYGRVGVTRSTERSSAWKADVEARRQAKLSLRKYWGPAYASVSSILFEEDPIGINLEDNTDEYEPEVETILPRLALCRSSAAVQAMVHEEFVRWFNPAAAGSVDRYQRIAERIWSEAMPLLEASGRK